MTKAILPDGRQVTYKYDAFGRRIKKTVTDKSGQQTTTEFLWQGDNLIAETDNKEHYQSYIYEPNSFKPLALIVGRGKEHKVYHYQLDHIGTPLDLTNREGKAVWSAQYLAYGTIYTQHTEEVTNPLRFQGQYFDQETGLHYNRHRYYNPKSGLFTTADPIGLAGGLNNYQYVKNPTGWVDPLGLADVPMVGGGCGGKSESNSNKTVLQLPDEIEAPNVAKGGFTSTDKHVADVANAIEKAYPGHVVGVNVPMKRADGSLITDADILTKNAIIQVKSGGGKGLGSQIQRTEIGTGIPTIGYGPDLKPSILKNSTSTNDLDLLIDVVKP